jgi:RNA polymerase sigma-70 factor, ECF subfamily
VLVLAPTPVEPEESICQHWLNRARAGDAEAFGELCRSVETRLVRHAAALCGNATLAEELAQETLVEAWQSLHRYRERCRFFTWLCAILLNRFRNHRRRKRLIAFSELAGSDNDPLEMQCDQWTDDGASPDQTIQRREQAALIRQCMNALPPKHQQVIHLRFFVDDSLEGIAAALGCSVGTVKSRLFHALDKLRGMNGLSEERVRPPGKDPL